jgi:hypothetical protein
MLKIHTHILNGCNIIKKLNNPEEQDSLNNVVHSYEIIYMTSIFRSNFKQIVSTWMLCFNK